MKIALLSILLLVVNISIGQNIDKEKVIGEEANKMVISQIGLYDHSYEESLNEIGQQLLNNLDNKLFDYTFSIIDMEIPNAMALPGGYVYFSRGILVLVNSEDELAGVMSHEINHVYKQHSRKARNRSLFSDILKIPGALLGSVAPVAGGLLIAPLALYDSGYSRSNEKQADKEGVKLSAATGYDPNGLPLLLDKISDEIKMETGEEEESTWFDSHPYTPKRVEDMNKQISKLDYTSKNTTSEEHAAFIRKLEGICIGDNPKNGIFQNGKFIHPDLAFSFTYPKDWRKINTPSSVGFISKDEKSQLVFSIADSAKDPSVYSDELINTFYKYYNVSPTRDESIEINGFPAQIVQFEEERDEAILVATFLWLTRDDRSYEFVQIGDDKYHSILEKTAKSLHIISAEERDSIYQTLLKVVQVNEGETLEELSKRTNNVLELDYTALINNLASTDSKLESSSWIKIGVEVKY